MSEELSVCWNQMLIFVSLSYFAAKTIPAESQLVTMHNSPNEADSSCEVNEGMTLEGGSEKSQIKRTSVEVIVTD